MQFRGQISTSLSPKKCLREENLQDFIETEVMQLGMLHWHQKEGKRCLISFLDEKHTFSPFHMVKIWLEVKNCPILEHNFGLVLMIWQPLRSDARFSLGSKLNYDID